MPSFSSESHVVSQVVFGEEARKSFTYKGMQIHPFCLDFMRNGNESGINDKEFQINLDVCSATTSLVEENQGSLHAEYPPSEGLFGGDSNYKVLAQKEREFLVKMTTNGGGTGFFDSIGWVSVEGNEIRMRREVGVGDRCNGGFTENVNSETGNLEISVNVTPADIIELAASSTIKAYEDLEASANSCFGTANYLYNIKDEELTFDFVDLGSGEGMPQIADENSAWTNGYAYQPCFNRLFNSYISSGKTNFKIEELREFGEKFLSTCVKE